MPCSSQLGFALLIPSPSALASIARPFPFPICRMLPIHCARAWCRAAPRCVSQAVRRTPQLTARSTYRLHSTYHSRPTGSSQSSSSSLLALSVIATTLAFSSSLVLSQSESSSSASSNESLHLPIPSPSTPPAALRSRPFTSSPLFPHPTRPHVSIATADSLPELVDQRGLRNQHVLIEVYSPHCHACERLTPILDQVAHVLSMLTKSQSYTSPSSSSSSPSFLVAVMDDERNHKPGFLTPEEERYLPIIKFFLAPSSPSAPLPEPVTYHGPHNAASILNFIASSLPPSTRPSPSLLSSLIQSTEAETYERVRKVFNKQREEEIERDPTLLLFDKAPCGQEMKSMMEWMILKRYRSSENDETDKQSRQIMKGFEDCVRGKRKETQKYWKSVRDIAQAQLKMGDGEAEEEEEEEQGEEKAGGEEEKGDGKAGEERN